MALRSVWSCQSQGRWEEQVWEGGDMMGEFDLPVEHPGEEAQVTSQQSWRCRSDHTGRKVEAGATRGWGSPKRLRA